jgi:hypothetical protein
MIGQRRKWNLKKLSYSYVMARTTQCSRRSKATYPAANDSYVQSHTHEF